jgi:hypothetical protein
MPPNSEPAPPDDLSPEELAALEAEMLAAAEADAEEARDRKWELVGSRRIEAYADFLAAVCHLLRPTGGGDVLPGKPARLSQLTRGEIDLAIRAVARDVQRLARFTGPRMADHSGEAE